MRRLALPILLLVFLIGACGSSPKQAKSSHHKAKKYSDIAVEGNNSRRGQAVTEDEDASLEDVIYDSLGHRSGTGVHYGKHSIASGSYDIPMTDNRYVQKWIDYFTGRGRGHFARYLARSGRFIPYMHSVLKKYGVPSDIVYLSMIESGFNTRAASWASAVGPWQFIKSTGAMYGLNVDYYVDERRDIEKSTHAAAQHLKDLYDEFGHWYLAFAAYNAGAGKVRNAINRHGTNFWDMVEGNYLRQETKDYVPKIIAAAMISKNPSRYGFREVEYQVPIDYEKVKMSSATDLEVAAECAGVDPDLIRLLNSELLQDMTPPHIQGYALKIPRGTRDRFMRKYASLSPSQRMRAIEYVVRGGDSLGEIADRFGVSEAQIAKANPGDVEVRHIKKTEKVKVYGKRGKFKWQKRSFTVARYEVDSGSRLTIPRGGVSKSDSMRDDAAARAASREFGINVARADSDLPKGKNKKDKDKKDKKKPKEEVQIAAREPLPVAAPPAQPSGPKSDDLAVEGDPFAKPAEVETARSASTGSSDLSPMTGAPAEKTDVNRGTPMAFNDRPDGAGPSENQLQQAVDSLGVNRDEPAVGDPAGGSAPAAAEAPAEAAAPVAAKRAPAAPKAKPSIYTVKRGDTLSEVAQAHGVSVEQLKQWNGRKLAHGLQSGSKIVVQAPAAPAKSPTSTRVAAAKPAKTIRYKVKRGDNLTTIAKRHDTTTAELLKLNGMKSPKIVPGTMLVVRRAK
ncbi:MAG TPA: LysM peptidoglycan-binding domain-containing protein [bacterium]|nr:LysM peptidoglycan-binding domain-containing protein [bacterium]